MSSDGAFLEAAASTARRIVDDAIWYDGRCSWMGAAVDPAQPWRAEYRPLEPNVYDGTAGVALFLAQLADVTGDDAVRRTALGAMRHAVGRVPSLPPGSRDGFHAGSLGIAFAAARVAALLETEELHASAARVLAEAAPSPRPDRCPDVVMGSAGAIVALLALGDAIDDPSLVAQATATAESLVDSATVTRHGWSWGDPGRRHPRHLCGLAHGAAGVGWALLELFARTREQRFRAAAIGAFDYERSWLDRASGSWPDLRMPGQRRGALRAAPSPAAGSWCHGEGGIALVRMRAFRLLGSDDCRRDAEVAVEAIRRHVAAALPYEIDDVTLCHGVGGAADVLLCAATTLGSHAEPAVELGRAALERHGAAGRDWPSGQPAGTTPGLFRGSSGVGWWFLRLHDRSIPSPLTLPVGG